MMRRMRGGAHFNIVGHAKRWFALSGLLIVISLVALFVRGVNPGLEFSGGTKLQAEAERDVTVEQVRDAIDGAGLVSATVQGIGDRGYIVQGEHLDADQRTEARRTLADVLGTDPENVDVTTIGPKWGAQITNKAIRALIIFLIFAVIYLSFRLEWKMAIAGMVAVVHDLVVTAGVYSLSGFEVTPSTVIALLTILGYSLYDTVVIFDRVKERTVNLSAAGSLTFSSAANDALNQVLLRSFNTSMVALIPVGSLLFVGSLLLGAQTLRELALALFVGLAIGTYSSVFVATPIVARWKEREDRWRSLRERIAARGGETGAVSTPAATAAETWAPPAQVAVAERPSAPKRQRSNQRKKKKRKHGR